MTVKSDLVEARGVLDNTSKQLREALTEAGPDMDLSKIKSLQGDDDAKIDAIRALKEKEDELGAKVDRLAQAVKDLEGSKAFENQTAEGKAQFQHPGDNQGGQRDERQKSLGELFVESKAYTEKAGNQGPLSALAVKDVKTLMTTSAGWAPESTRTGKLVDIITRPLQVTDLFPVGRTSQASVVYMEETTFTNNAAETAEAGTYPESALALTQRSVPVQKVATFLPVTDEQLEDVDGIQSYVDNRLMFMIRQRLDSQLLVGDGTPPNIRGVNNAANIQTQALGADVTPDAIYKAMTLVRVTGRANPSGIVIHPTDWQDIKLLRSSDGIYIWGNPADNNPDRIWGVNVVLSDAQTLNTAIVGDFQNYSELVLRRDIEVQVSNSHSTYFIEGKQAIRADMRVAAIYYRGQAFCKVTGI
jgi:HK97 family phage major capsid protein